MNTTAWIARTVALLLLVVVVRAEGEKQGKILMLGDSVTEGGMPAAVRTPLSELTSDKVAWTLVNAGVGGETAEGGAARVADLLEAEQPDVVTVSYGLNDLARNHGVERFRANMLKIIETIQQRSPMPRVVLLTCTPLDDARHSLGKSKSLNDRGGADRVLEIEHNAVTRRLAAEKHLPLVDLHRQFMTDPEWKKYIRDDGVHLTREGYEFAGKYVAAALAAWYQAEVAKSFAAVKVRDAALAGLARVLKAAPKASGPEDRKELLVALDIVWRVCPYLPAQGHVWHAVKYGGTAGGSAPEKSDARSAESPTPADPATLPQAH